MRVKTSVLTLSLATIGAGLTACGTPDEPNVPEVEPDVFASEHAEWRANRRDRLVTPPGGSVLWVGLWELEEGSTEFGSDPELAITLPDPGAPPLVGTLTRTGREVRLDPTPGAGFSVRGGDSFEGSIDLAHDRTDDPTELMLGSLGMRIHAEGGTDRLWLRVWDEGLPLRETFQLPESFPVDLDWRVPARFEAYDEPVQLRVREVTAGTLEYRVPGELVFDWEGEEHRLLAVASETATSFFIMLWDESARTDTYQAGRYMRVPFPEEGKTWTVIDFNRAYNAPCAFTAHSVCALPPPENHLSFAIDAGEKRPVYCRRGEICGEG